MTANVANYEDQGGAVWNVGGTLNILSGGNITVADGGKLYKPVTTGSTAATMSNSGITKITSTATKTYNLADPVAGVQKEIICISTGTATKTVKCSTAGNNATFDATHHTLTFAAVNTAVILIGLSSTRWAVMSNVNSVGIA